MGFEIHVFQKDGLLMVDPATEDILLGKNPIEFHSDFHRLSQNVYAETIGKAQAATQFEVLGFGVIKGFVAPDAAHKLSQAYDDQITVPDVNANTLVSPDAEMKTQISAIISQAMANGVAELLEAHLNSFFRIDHIQCMRTQSSAQQDGLSFRWHRDFQPIAQVHIMLYLTPCDQNTPATIFTTLEDTRRLAKLGYTFPAFEDRVRDINDLLPKDEGRVKFHRPLLDTGDATIFDATRILHRGVTVGGRPRDVVILNILPSLNPWDKEMELLDQGCLFGPRDTLWTNPFALGMPNIKTGPKPPTPQWFEQSHYFSQ